MEFRPSHAHSLLDSRVRSLRARAVTALGLVLPEIEVRTDLRGMAAGRCHITRAGRALEIKIRFNVLVLEEAWLLEDAWRETAPHEVAHAAIAAQAFRNGRRVRPHGPEWRALCLALGGSGRTTHALPLRRARRHREFEYRLPEGEHVWLGAVRHKRLQSGKARYYHRRRRIHPGAFTGRMRTRS